MHNRERSQSICGAPIRVSARKYRIPFSHETSSAFASASHLAAELKGDALDALGCQVEADIFT